MRHVRLQHRERAESKIGEKVNFSNLSYKSVDESHYDDVESSSNPLVKQGNSKKTIENLNENPYTVQNNYFRDFTESLVPGNLYVDMTSDFERNIESKKDDHFAENYIFQCNPEKCSCRESVNSDFSLPSQAMQIACKLCSDHKLSRLQIQNTVQMFHGFLNCDYVKEIKKVVENFCVEFWPPCGRLNIKQK